MVFSAVGKPEPTSSDEKESAASRSQMAPIISWVKDFALKFWPVIVVQSLFLVIFTLIFGWHGYFALWFLPLVTLVSFYNDFRIFCEHSLIGREASDKSERMISFISNPIERFFIAPNHMNYHAEHHLFPYVSHSNLPGLRHLIRACPELNDQIVWRRSYFGHLRDYIRGLQSLTQANSMLAVREEAGPVSF